MMMPDFQEIAGRFVDVAAGGKALLDRLRALATEAEIAEKGPEIAALVQLAQEGQATLVAAAREQRDQQIASLTSQIEAIGHTLAASPPAAVVDELTSLRNTLRADRAELELIGASDFSRVVDPQFVTGLIAQLQAAQREVAMKKTLARAIPILTGATELAAKIAAAVGAFA